MKNNRYGIIMAGGIGSRFWPESTEENPKQFLDLLGSGRTFIQQTFDRLSKVIPPSNIYILTNERYKQLVKEQLPVEESQIITEPVMRNTAPAILYAALKIHKMDPEAIFYVAPSDHYISREEAFKKDIEAAFKDASKKDILITLGIVPNAPHTGYGYIKFDKNDREHIKKVLQFTEKPDYNKAVEFLRSGDYLWNAGMFIWSTQSILKAFKKYLPEMYGKLFSIYDKLNTSEEKKSIQEVFPHLENISIDYGILEKADNVYVLPAGFIWNDLGAWNAVYEQLKSEDDNVVINSELLADNSAGNLIKTQRKKVVIKDLNNYAIVETSDVLMIIPREDDQKVKEYREKLK
jgi:mannose-1-phosphate guanylyltransferase